IRASGGVAQGADPRLIAEHAELQSQVERLQREKAAAEQAIRQLQEELEALRASSASGGGGDEQQALRVLMLAQRTADDHVADARREADKLLADARAK